MRKNLTRRLQLIGAPEGQRQGESGKQIFIKLYSHGPGHACGYT